MHGSKVHNRSCLQRSAAAKKRSSKACKEKQQQALQATNWARTANGRMFEAEPQAMQECKQAKLTVGSLQQSPKQCELRPARDTNTHKNSQRPNKAKRETQRRATKPAKTQRRAPRANTRIQKTKRRATKTNRDKAKRHKSQQRHRATRIQKTKRRATKTNRVTAKSHKANRRRKTAKG